MEIGHVESEFKTPRLHPYVGTRPGHAGFVDFKREPERIPHVLEDFTALNHEPSIQTFYELLRWLNGPESTLESCDCALLGPRTHSFPFSSAPLCLDGRLMIMYRDLEANCSSRIEALYNALAQELSAVDPELVRSQAAIELSFSPTLFAELSTAEIHKRGRRKSRIGDPGRGMQLMLNFQAFGDNAEEAFERLDRVFRNIDTACRAVATLQELG